MRESRYLEDVLQDYGSTRNVLVQLSSAHAVYTGVLEPMYIPDSVGNHYASNWLATIANNPSLQRKFIVEQVIDNGTTHQTTVYLRAKKGDDGLQLLELASNSTSCADYYSLFAGNI